MSESTSGRWWALRTTLIIVTVFLALVVGFFAFVAETSGPANSEPAGTIATGQVDGRSVAVVAYKADTMGHFDVFRLEAAGFSTQAEAFDLATGTRIWDTMLMTEFGGTDAEVLGMGSEYVYIRSATGLLILDAATGDIVARDSEIAGLGENYIASFDAYEWDAVSESVVLLDVDGAVLSISVDEVEARPAADGVVERWRDELNIGDGFPNAFYPDAWEETSYRAPLPGGDDIEPSWASDGWNVDVLLDETGVAAGARYGFVVTQTYQPVSTEDTMYVLQAGELPAQRLLGTVEADSAVFALADDAAGHIVMLVDGDDYRGRLVVASADGIRSSTIGERGFFGQ